MGEPSLSIFDKLTLWVADIVAGCGRIHCEMSIVLTDDEVEEVKRLGVYREQFLHCLESGIYGDIVVPKGYKLVGVYDGVVLLQRLPTAQEADDLCLI